MDEDVVIDLRDDWEFHQATGMVSVQIGTTDMTRAAARLIDAAAEVGQSVHATAVLVIDRQLRLCSEDDTAEGGVAPGGRDQLLRMVRSELRSFLQLRVSRPFDTREAAEYADLCRREADLLRAVREA